MYNFISFEFNSIIPSNLSFNNILMLGRAFDRFKRFELGVKSMKYKIKEIHNCEMKIISHFDFGIQKLIKSIKFEKLYKICWIFIKTRILFQEY